MPAEFVRTVVPSVELAAVCTVALVLEPADAAPDCADEVAAALEFEEEPAL
jgi:hypothetical protein